MYTEVAKQYLIRHTRVSSFTGKDDISYLQRIPRIMIELSSRREEAKIFDNKREATRICKFLLTKRGSGKYEVIEA